MLGAPFKGEQIASLRYPIIWKELEDGETNVIANRSIQTSIKSPNSTGTISRYITYGNEFPSGTDIINLDASNMLNPVYQKLLKYNINNSVWISSRYYRGTGEFGILKLAINGVSVEPLVSKNTANLKNFGYTRPIISIPLENCNFNDDGTFSSFKV